MDFGFDTLPEDKRIILSVSGGRDSTAMVLELWDYVQFHQLDLDTVLLYGDTRFNSSKAREVVETLSKKTGWELHIARYEGEERPIQILKESFQLVPKALSQLDEGKKEVKNLFRCCDVLKKRPIHDYLKQYEKDSFIVVLGIKGGDGALHRRYRMRELRKQGTFYRTKKNDGIMYFYPLRDAQERDILNTLRRFHMDHVRGSGCVMCPFFLIYDMDGKDLSAARRSRLFAKLNGIEPRIENQPPLRAFCSEVS